MLYVCRHKKPYIAVIAMGQILKNRDNSNLRMFQVIPILRNMENVLGGLKLSIYYCIATWLRAWGMQIVLARGSTHAHRIVRFPPLASNAF